MLCGNDIVDLQSSEAAGKGGDRRFVDRILTADEIKLFASFGSSDLLLWLMWAAKEAAYKVASKTQPGLSFIPRHFQVSFPDWSTLLCQRLPFAGADGLVMTSGGVLRIRAEITPDHIHVVAAASRAILNRVVAAKTKPWGEAGEIPQAEESNLTSRFALEAVAAVLGTEPSELEIRRLPMPRGLGPPVVYHEKKPAAVDLSLSHHGRYAAYAFVA